MRTASLRLESFIPSAPCRDLRETERAATEAFARGLQQGREQGRAASIDDLTRQLGQIETQIAETDAQRTALRAQILNDLQPLLLAIVDTLAPLSNRARLTAALSDLLAQHLATQPDLRIVLRCPPELRDTVAECARQSESAAIQIEIADFVEPAVELVAGPSRSLIAPDAFTAALRELLATVLNEE